MLNAVLSGERVNALFVERGSQRHDELYAAAHEDRLTCPGCGSFLDFSYGEKKHAYFRHKKGLGEDCRYKHFFDRKRELEELKWLLAERFRSLGRKVYAEEPLTEDHWTDLIIEYPSGKKAAIELVSFFRNTNANSDTADKFAALHSLYSDRGITDIIILQPDVSSSESNRIRHTEGLIRYNAERSFPTVTYDSEKHRMVIYFGSDISTGVTVRIDDFDIDEDGNVKGKAADIYAGMQEKAEAERAERERRAAEERAEREAQMRQLLESRRRQEQAKREAEEKKRLENKRKYEEAVRAEEEEHLRRQLESREKRAAERAQREKRLKDEHDRHMAGLTLVQTALEKYFSRMNDRQREAVFAKDGAVLVLAGAGSGKTTVLVDRIANMILFGDGYFIPDEELTAEERGFLECYDGDHDPYEVDILRDIAARDTVKPWSILAITFTNKAAGELKYRLSAMLGDDGALVRASTFHSACVRILRREITALGYSQGFTIYDTDDTKRLIKACVQALDLSPKSFPERVVMSYISDAKNDLVDETEYEITAGNDYFTSNVARIYKEYQKRLRASDALDFDDIIMLTVRLFEEHPDVLDHYQNLYRYIMVDEYQDTNHAQYVLVSLLAQKYGNLCGVGDDDQSIYSFRGATIDNILSFEDQFPDCRTIRLEQNYRSTQTILDAANSVINNNKGRKEKSLWTDREGGEIITVYRADSERAEAQYVADTIAECEKNGMSYDDFAVLYRMNAQSNAIEHAFRTGRIPYRMIGGLRFYDRREIKDILSYMAVIVNPSDIIRFRRVINLPKRGIGESTVAMIEEISSVVGEAPLRIMEDSDVYAPLVKKAPLLKQTAAMFADLREFAEDNSADKLIDRIMSVTGYAEMLREEGDEGVTRAENIDELKSNIRIYTERCTDMGLESSLAGFLEEAALYSDADRAEDDQPAVNMMTIHSAKGLEFPVVFLVGAEENIFPSQRSKDNVSQLEEERRLAYVAITRAKDKLYITHTRSRLLMGQTQYNTRSRFVREIDPDLIEELPGAPCSDTVSVSKRTASAPLPPGETGFSVGERVVHPKFGGGMILSAKPMGGDEMLEIAFDSVGTKKVMAKFARLKRE